MVLRQTSRLRLNFPIWLITSGRPFICSLMSALTAIRIWMQYHLSPKLDKLTLQEDAIKNIQKFVQHN